MSLTVTRERKLSDSHVVTPSAPLRQLRKNRGKCFGSLDQNGDRIYEFLLITKDLSFNVV